MANPSQTQIIGVGAKNIEITNKILATANTEYAHATQSGLKEIIIRSRDIATTKIAFTENESGTKYVTLKPLTVLTLTNLNFSSKNLYLQSSIDSAIIEIIELY